MVANPICFSELYTRFELGGEFPNGTIERVTQATTRASQLWCDVFANSTDLILLIDDWDSSGQELWPSDPAGGLLSLIDGSRIVTSSRQLIRREGFSHHRHLIRCDSAAIDYHSILRGISNLEQGMNPRINQTVYFVSTAEKVAFYMYDDRGCLLYFGDPQHCKAVEELRSEWVVRRH